MKDELLNSWLARKNNKFREYIKTRIELVSSKTLDQFKQLETELRILSGENIPVLRLLLESEFFESFASSDVLSLADYDSTSSAWRRKFVPLLYLVENVDGDLVKLLFIEDDWDYSIPQIPPFLFNFHHLEYLEIDLDISAEPFELPDAFNNIPLLKRLDLIGLRVQHLPPSIGQLNHLRELTLSDTEFTTLPEYLLNIKTLETLIIRFNKCKLTLPRELFELPHLKILRIEHVELSLPELSQENHTLLVLSFSGSKIKYIPRSFSLLSALEVISMQFTPLPYQWSGLNNLDDTTIHNQYHAQFQPD